MPEVARCRVSRSAGQVCGGFAGGGAAARVHPVLGRAAGVCRLPLILASLTEILANRAVNLGQCRGRLSVPGSMMCELAR